MKNWLVAMTLLAGAPAAQAAVVAASGYAVHVIPTPGNVQGGVVRRGESIVVGQGSFGAGLQSIVRLDAGVPTTIATGFNSLGGFDVDAAGTLYVVDNCGECSGATTGDTVFAIPDAFTRTSALAAASATLASAGSIPAAADVLPLGDGSVLVSDAAGPGAGRVVRVQGGTPTGLISSLGYAGGLARAGSTLFVGNVDGSFVGSVGKYALDGMSLGPLVSGLPGAYAQAFDADGLLLVTGEFSLDCEARVLAVAPNGDVTERASGFCFSADVFFDAARDEALVLDGGASGVAAQQIVAICRDGDGDGVCDADDVCPAIADPGQEDADDDGLGDACDACMDGAVADAALTLGKLDAPAGDDTLSFKGTLTFGTEPALDPVANGIRLVLDDGGGPLLDATLPGGAFDKTSGTGWKAKNGKFKWKSATGVLGITKATVVTGRAPLLVKFTVTGKNGAYGVDPDDLPIHAALVFGPGAGECGETGFTAAPGCVVKAKRNKVQCK